MQRRNETLEQDSRSMMAKIAGLEEQLTVERSKLHEAQVKMCACMFVCFFCDLMVVCVCVCVHQCVHVCVCVSLVYLCSWAW